MQGRRSALHIEIHEHTHATLSGRLRRQKTLLVSPNGARAILLLAEGHTVALLPGRSSYANGRSASGHCALSRMASTGCTTKNDPLGGRFFPPVVALSVVKLAGERPDVVGRSVSQGERPAELARQLVRDGVVEASSPQTVQRSLRDHKLKPWR